jgi:hypothetical protein
MATFQPIKAIIPACCPAEFALNRAFLAACERDDPPAVASDEGKALLTPFLPVIQAAHRNELPAVPLPWSRAGELNGYVCAISAGIWYGATLDEPERLTAHLENLRRLQSWYDTLHSAPKENSAP